MVAPVRPSDFQKVIVTPDDNPATAIMKLIKCAILIFKLHNYMFDEGGYITDGFKDNICLIQCPTADTNTTRLPT